MGNNQPIKVRVEEGDALNYRVDVLAVKYAQAYYGLDAAIVQRFEEAGIPCDKLQPPPHQFELVSSHGQLTAPKVLFYGVESLREFRYQQIREFSRGVLQTLAKTAPDTEHVGLTLHGANYGLDEVEAFEAEIAGLVDAVVEGKIPENLKLITIIERNTTRTARLNKSLKELLPSGFIVIEARPLSDEEEKSKDRLRAAGYASESKPTVFVAMPFDESMDDTYHYGISGAVRKVGFVCERADKSAFTGEILAWIKQRIQTANLLIADLSMANANVYLEVGYAWGCNIPTVLVVRDEKELEFDLKGQRCLVYDNKIKKLEEMLYKELSKLVKNRHFITAIRRA